MSDTHKKYPCPICGDHCEVLESIMKDSESIIADSELDQTKFSDDLDIWDTWDDEGGSIPPDSDPDSE